MKNDNSVNDPATDYRLEITWFKSFEAMNEHDHKAMALATPTERIQNVMKLILSIYKVELSQIEDYTTIHFV